MVEALIVIGFGAWIPLALACYAFGWWWRGRHEREMALERRLREDPDLAFMSGEKWPEGMRYGRTPPFTINRIKRP